MNRPLHIPILFFLILSALNCKNSQKEDFKLFQLLASEDTGISFSNDLEFTEEYNPYTFKNFFNGGGVGVGDINNDGLLDIYFTGNLTDNKLYLNKGNLLFEDITIKSKVSCSGVWSTGVTFVDINADGWMDIYVCKSGRPGGKNRHNELFINNGDLTFTEKSKEYGLDFTGLSTHAVFFDYDRDNDLDCYLLNNSLRSVGGYDIVEGLREVSDSLGGNRLLRNEQFTTSYPTQNGINQKIYFTDVSKAAGIYGSAIGFGLGVSVSDLNGDQWPDLFVSNDFFERDYMYINNRNGTFREVITEATKEISLGSMGADVADIDNDCLPDIFVTEMLPDKMKRYKTKALFENWEKYSLNVNKGYHRQFGRNMLHLNMGNIGPQNEVRFAEISRYTGMDATDWSWGALIADFNNDGNKDVFVANGIYKDLTDLDYINFDFNPDAIKDMITNKQKVITSMMETVPSEAQLNFLFINQGSYQFSSAGEESGINTPSFSNGSVYADLDNDGDMDIVTNNINEPCHIFRNNSQKGNSNFINISLVFPIANVKAIGSKVVCYAGNQKFMQELNPMRGFQSCVDPRLHFGLGAIKKIDSIAIYWPDGKNSIIKNDIIVNSFLSFDYSKINKKDSLNELTKNTNALFIKDTDKLNIKHVENEFSDFDRDKLLFYMISNEGPHVAIKDINNDGLDDVVLGGSSGFPTQIAFQQKNGSFRKEINKSIAQNQIMEDSRILVEDFNFDGFQDIFVCAGGSELSNTSDGLKDRLYFGSKKGFYEDSKLFNAQINSTSSIVWIDIDHDGDKDIFTAGRMETFYYGIPANSYVYTFDKGSYSLSQDLSNAFKQFGMITDAKKADVDGDHQDELIIMKDMGNIEILQFTKNGVHNLTSSYGLSSINGYWSSFEAEDIDNDGDIDLLVCNKGLNNRLANGHGLYEMYINDFDANGQIEQISCFSDSSGVFPLNMRDDIVRQLPVLKKRMLRYREFASASLEHMFDKKIIDRSVVYKINEFRTGILINENGVYKFMPLPVQAQWTDQKAGWISDINGDGKKDILLGGNQFRAKPEIGIDASSYGSYFVQDENLKFRYIPNKECGLYLDGEVRDIKPITIKNERFILFAINNNNSILYKIKNEFKNKQ